MSDKERMRQKMQAQVDEWKADLDKLRAKASAADADVRREIDTRIEALEARVEQGREKLDELARASDEAWDTMKAGVEAAWETLRSAGSEAAGRLGRK